MKLDKKQLTEYFSRYYKEYRRYLEEAYSSRKNEFSLYKDYPYEVNVYTDERSTRVFLDFGRDFRVNVYEVDKVPERDEGKGKLKRMINNRYLLGILDKPEYMAQSYIESDFAHERMMEEQALYEIESMEKYYAEEIDRQVSHWFENVEKTREVMKTTLKESEKEVRTAILTVANQYSSFEVYEQIGHALFMASFDLCDTLESSVFLAMNGKYRAALALLRRWLETVCMGIYYDTELKNASAPQKNSVLKEIQKWLAKPQYHPFKGKNGIVSKIIDSDTEYKGSEILKARPSATQASFKAYIEEQYSDLSKYVHSGATDLFEDLIVIAQFDDDLFAEWFNRFTELNTICGILLVLKFPETMKNYSSVELNGFPLLDINTIEWLKKFV